MTNNIDRAADIINSFCCGYCDHFGQEQAHALAAEQIEYGMEYTFSEGAVETYWPHPSAATVDQVKVLDDVFGVPPGIAAMHEGETITRKRFMARRVSPEWVVTDE